MGEYIELMKIWCKMIVSRWVYHMPIKNLHRFRICQNLNLIINKNFIFQSRKQTAEVLSEWQRRNIYFRDYLDPYKQ